MALLAFLKRFVGLALAMLVIAMSLQSAAQARWVHGQFFGGLEISNPTSADPSAGLETPLYVSEESEEQAGWKSRSQRLGSSDPLSIATFVPPELAGAFVCRLPLHRPARAAGELFLSPLKTGPPAV